mgnify:CR=1 FL=1
MTKCGYVSVVGRPNAGKSSLLNWLVGEKIAMVSHKANATRRRSNIIVMHEDEEGFLYPQVDVTLCIDCGLCEKVCPVINQNMKKDSFFYFQLTRKYA